MTLQYSTRVRNAKLDAIETAIGTSAILRVYSGSKPATPADAATGTLLAEMALPSDWLAAASGGVKAKSGTWEDLSANAGTATAAGYFRVYASDGTTCDMQGTCTLTGAGGDMTLDGTFTAGQAVTVTAFGITDNNA